MCPFFPSVCIVCVRIVTFSSLAIQIKFCDHSLKNNFSTFPSWWQMPLIPVLGRQRQADLVGE